MLETFKERLTYSVHKSVTEIDKTIAAIDKLLERLVAQREIEFQLLNSIDSNYSNSSKSSSVDEKIKLLCKFKEELFKKKEQSLLMLNNFDRLFRTDSRYPATHGGVSSVFIFTDEFLLQADNCYETAEMISSDTDSLLKKTQSIFDDASYQETEELLRCVYEYRSATDELSEMCRETSFQLRSMQKSYETCDEDITMEARNFCDEGRVKEEHTNQQVAAPMPSPVQASYESPAVNYNSCVGSAGPTKSKPDAHTNKSQSGFFGLFRRKKKDVNAGDKDIVSPPQVDSVQFSAVAPDKVVPGKYIPISIVMYEDSFRKTVDDIVRSIGKNAKESKSGYHDVERNSLVKVVLSSHDVTIEDDAEEQMWNGKYLNFEFTAKIPSNFSEEQILFSAAVYVNDVIATKLKLILDCEKKTKHNISVTRSDIISAFVSYASQDRSRVAAIIQGMKKARPDMDIFFDIESLRSGQKWEEVLKKEIDGRDVLFLCWSKFAKDSKWVDMEWRYAFDRKGEDFIEPIPIDSPDVCPPPIELQKKHFNDKMLYVIKFTE